MRRLFQRLGAATATERPLTVTRRDGRTDERTDVKVTRSQRPETTSGQYVTSAL